jgi:O-antigen/teichoic acid export membrane protein
MNLFSKGSLVHNFGWMLVGQCSGYGLKVVYFIAIARLLGVLQYGVVVGAFALVNIVAQYGRLGTSTLLLRYVSADHTRFAAYWGNVLGVSLTMGGLLIVALRVVAPHLLDPASAALVLLLAVGSCICEQITIGATQAFQAFEDMRITALFNQMTSLLRAVAAVGMLLVLHRATAWQWAMASMVASAIATILAVSTVTIRLGWPRFMPYLALKRAGEGLEYSFASSTVNAYDDLDKAMLSHYGMSAANGIYGLAYRIIDMATVPIASIQLAAEPRLYKLASLRISDSMILGRRLLKHGLLVSSATALCMFALAPAIPLLAGTGFSEAISALRWLCLIPIFRSVHKLTGSVLTCTGRQRYRTITQVTAVLLNFGLNLWLIPAYGWRGAAWASLATDGALAMLNFSLVERLRTRLTKAGTLLDGLAVPVRLD